MENTATQSDLFNTLREGMASAMPKISQILRASAPEELFCSGRSSDRPAFSGIVRRSKLRPSPLPAETLLSNIISAFFPGQSIQCVGFVCDSKGDLDGYRKDR